MATLLECLNSLPPDMVMRDMTAVRKDVAPVSEHIVRVHHDEDGYEVREESRHYGKVKRQAIGLVGGPTVYRQV